jgi:hypothetical protein
MSDEHAAGTLQCLDLLVQQQQRHADSLERIAGATEAIRQDVNLMVATSMTAALVYPWANDTSVVRVVLIRSSEDERRLRESLQRFETSDRALPMEEWLKNDGFTLLVTKHVSLERQGIGTFKATAATHKGLTTAPTELPCQPLQLESDAKAS